MNAESYQLEQYDYTLPEERIAQNPPKERGTSRLMLLDKKTGLTHDTMFAQLPDILPPGALLVANNSRVVPARLFGVRPSGGKAELLLLSPPPLLEQSAKPFLGDLRNREGHPASALKKDWYCARAEVLLKPGKYIREGDTLDFGPIKVEVLKKRDFGKHDVCIYWQDSLHKTLEAIGSLPLPPYIKREQGPEDRARYQTMYAREDKSGSVAAPTAGLHFTKKLRDCLAERGFGWEEVTLHVGYGTFSPVREADIRQHPMHGEYVEISEATAHAVNMARKEGRPVIAVGTTSARTLEGTALAAGGYPLPEKGWQGWTDIFIYPGYTFNVVDGLITNFHLPKSSLLMLVSALAGREQVLAAYEHAVQEKYRFFSYGDAMFIR